ncbi:MAG: immunoglobulin domain-containing protein [Limisphaerales bacterium]
MKKRITQYAILALTALGCAASLSAQGQNIGQWDFNSGNLAQTSGANLGPLTYADATGLTSNQTAFGSTAVLGLPNINGQAAYVMGFTNTSSLANGIGYMMPTPPANGGGSLVNEYTVIFDVYYPESSVYRPLLQMDNGTLDQIEALFVVDSQNTLQVTNTQGAALPSGAFGQISSGIWYRIGMTYDVANGTITVYTNGETAGVLNFSPSDVDSPYALYQGALFVFSSNQTNSPGYANSVQIRDSVLNPGQMEALGGPTAGGIPVNLPPGYSYISSTYPAFGESDVAPQPSISLDLNQGSTTIAQNSITLLVDGVAVAAEVTPGGNNDFLITYSVTNILGPLTPHTVTLSYTDSLLGARTKSVPFTIASYQVISLPAPIYFESFDELDVTNEPSYSPISASDEISVPDGSGNGFVQVDLSAPYGLLPAGWTVSNYTAIQDNTWDFTDGTSDWYINFVVVETNTIGVNTVFDDQGEVASSPGLVTSYGPSRLVSPPVILNGVLLTNLFSGNVLYCDSDQRQNRGGQVNYVITGDYDLTGHNNIYLAFHSMYEQNQDNLGAVEYSIDQGKTWQPALYLLDDGTTDTDGSDVVYTNGVIDVSATFNTSRSDQAYYLPYGAFIGAPITTALIPFIQGRRNDDQLSSKRIEVLRLAMADNQPTVRVRFIQAGTSSWFFGIDDFGLYSILIPQITQQPASQTVNANAPATFTVTASGGLLSYQWQFDGLTISNATSSSFTIVSTSPTNAGTYTVVVSNASGAITSSPALLTVNTTPVLTTTPSGEIVDLGGSVIFQATASGAVPVTYSWYFGSNLVQSSVSSNLALNNVGYDLAGNYSVVAANSYGAVTSTVASLDVWEGPITSNLVVHLTFDGNLNDTSGRGNNATYMFNGPNSSTTPRFVPGIIGTSAFAYTTTNDYSIQEYASLGYPADLQFGATTNFSVSLWCKYTDQSDDLPFISNKDWNSSSDPGWGVFTQTGGNYRINVTGPNGGTDKYSETDTPAVLKNGNWHNVVVSFQRAPFGSSAFVYGYLDGALVTKHPMGTVGTIDTFALPFTDSQRDPFPSTPAQSAFAVNIGQDGTGNYADNGSAYNINAAIDDLGVWRRALTANEALAIYRGGQAGLDLSQAFDDVLFVSLSGNNLKFTWMAVPGVQLEQASTLIKPVWTAVTGSLGASSATVPLGSGAGGAFFRLHKVQ